MAGMRRRDKHRKHITDEYLYGFPEPDASRNESVCVAGAPRGGNVVEVTLASGETGLCRLPTKFRKLILVNRGTFLIAGRAKQDFVTNKGTKGQVRFEAVHILHPDQVKHLRKQGTWPAGGDFGTDALRAHGAGWELDHARALGHGWTSYPG